MRDSTTHCLQSESKEVAEVSPFTWVRRSKGGSSKVAGCFLYLYTVFAKSQQTKNTARGVGVKLLIVFVFVYCTCICQLTADQRHGKVGGSNVDKKSIILSCLAFHINFLAHMLPTFCILLIEQNICMDFISDNNSQNPRICVKRRPSIRRWSHPSS